MTVKTTGLILTIYQRKCQNCCSWKPYRKVLEKNRDYRIDGKINERFASVNAYGICRRAIRFNDVDYLQIPMVISDKLKVHKEHSCELWGESKKRSSLSAVKTIGEAKKVGRAEDVAVDDLSRASVGVAGDLGNEVQRDTPPVKLGETIVPKRVGPELRDSGPACQALT